jgi:uncharacterized protein (DUF1499 family)
MRRAITLLLSTAGTVVLLYIAYAEVNGRSAALARVLGPVARKPVDFETLTLRRTPNEFLVAPPGLTRNARPHLEAPVFDLPVDQLRDRWMERIGAEPRVEQLAADPASDQFEFEQTSALFGLPDAITVRFLPTGERRSTLAVYSRSLYGRGDMGVNERRIRGWLEILR